MNRTPKLTALSASVKGLIDAAAQIQEDAPSAVLLQDIVARGELRPSEDEAIGFWFARFLTVRNNLWDVITEARTALDSPADAGERDCALQFFLVGYAAVCLLIRIDRVLLFQVGNHSLIQRKLNQPFPEYRIPGRQFTTIFSAFVDQGNVFAIRDAIVFSRRKRRRLLKLRDDPDVGFIARELRELESSLNRSKLAHLRRAWSYLLHKWRRRGAVSGERILAGVLEGFGRAASEICETDNKRVTPAIRETMAEFLQPGDVIVTRHAKALTNLFLPGFWPHAALYIGTPEQRQAAGIAVEPEKALRWIDDRCVLESRKDGVLFRPLSDTLSVDTFVVLRPDLSADGITTAVGRAIIHEGKKYNFDFNFFSSDRIVCTEVIYRAYDGLEDLTFPLLERAGRKTLSAEDLLDFALSSNRFVPVAIFGTARDDADDRVLFGEGVRDALIASYRSAR